MRQSTITRFLKKLLLSAVLAALVLAGGCKDKGQTKDAPGAGQEEDAQANAPSDDGRKDTADLSKDDRDSQPDGPGDGKDNATADQSDARVQEILTSMTLEEKVGQLFMLTPEQLTHVDTVIQAGETTRNSLEKYPVGGIIYFKDNIIDEQQIKTMISNTQSYSKYPLFIGVDEEGGSRVARVANNANFSVEKLPDMRVIGDSRNYDEAYRAGQVIGDYLHELGFNMDFAPVADVLTNPENTAIGERSFGPDADVDAQMTARAVKGLQEKGVSSVLKHFPGHGGTTGDSHESAVENNSTKEQLQNTDFKPFVSGIQAGADCVMAGHIALPAVTGDQTPATLSPAIITGILRGSLGFDRIVVTDSMQMGAITNYYSSGDAAIKAVEAGVDIILMPQDFEQAYESLLSAVQTSRISEARIDESVTRILRCKLR